MNHVCVKIGLFLFIGIVNPVLGVLVWWKVSPFPCVQTFFIFLVQRLDLHFLKKWGEELTFGLLDLKVRLCLRGAHAFKIGWVQLVSIRLEQGFKLLG